jgi:hypothetical protein
MPGKWVTNVAKKEALAAAEAAFMSKGMVTVCRETASQIFAGERTARRCRQPLLGLMRNFSPVARLL